MAAKLYVLRQMLVKYVISIGELVLWVFFRIAYLTENPVKFTFLHLFVCLKPVGRNGIGRLGKEG